MTTVKDKSFWKVGQTSRLMSLGQKLWNDMPQGMHVHMWNLKALSLVVHNYDQG